MCQDGGMEPQLPPVNGATGGASAATDILFQAQRLADRLRDEAEADAARIRETATAAERQRDDALAELEFAQNRLDEARADVSRMLSEAADHAGMITESAERNADELVADARLEAEAAMLRATADGDRIRQEAGEEAGRLLGAAPEAAARQSAELTAEGALHDDEIARE